MQRPRGVRMADDRDTRPHLPHCACGSRAAELRHRYATYVSASGAMPADSHDIHRTRRFPGCRRRRGSSALRCGAVAPRHFTTAVQSGSSHEKEEEASDSEGTTDGKGGTFPPDNSESLEVARVRPEIEVGFMSVKKCTLFLFICLAALPLESIYHCSGQAAQINLRHINLWQRRCRSRQSTIQRSCRSNPFTHSACDCYVLPLLPPLLVRHVSNVAMSCSSAVAISCAPPPIAMLSRGGRFNVISASSLLSIDLGWLSDRVADIPSVEWLVARVATAMEWPASFVMLSAGGVEYRYSSGTSAGEGTPLGELSRDGQHIEFRVALLDVEGGKWICRLCDSQLVNGPCQWLGHVAGKKHCRALHRQEQDDRTTARFDVLVDE
jgi:hypothetical protein